MLEDFGIPQKSDEEIVALVFKDKGYYQYLMARYEDKLSRYVVRLSGVSPEDVEDVLQEVFIKVYKNLRDFNFNFKFSSWIYRITHNETINYLRKNRGKFKMVDFEVDKVFVEATREDLKIKTETDKDYLMGKIKEAMKRLDKKYKEVIILRYIEGKDYQEISDILRKPMGTIATLLKRAKERLRKEVLNRGKN